MSNSVIITLIICITIVTIALIDKSGGNDKDGEDQQQGGKDKEC